MEAAAAGRADDAGRFWTWATAACIIWPAVAADRYRGPWNRPTAHPVLLVGTRYDPATPYANAQALAGELADARLLTNEGYGHTALTNPISCVKTYESRYLIDGTLPPPGATCRQDEPPFPAPKAGRRHGHRRRRLGGRHPLSRPRPPGTAAGHPPHSTPPRVSPAPPPIRCPGPGTSDTADGSLDTLANGPTRIPHTDSGEFP
ncbi:alpha/beta hydrolase [Streptomyces sp. NPDC015171]|uniref:alpha/beta hydrolase n=1 Tax=Streptomyces sp. NPDC015171 TaxID=3364945 RepID=UPI0036FCC2C0